MSAPARAFESGLAEEVHDGAGADGGAVEALVSFEEPLALLGLLDVGHEAVAVEVVDARDGDARHGERAKHARSHADGSDDVLLVWVELPDDLAEPSLGAEGVGFTGMPDVHRAEVGARGVGVSHAVDDGEVALVVGVLERSHLGMQPDGGVDGNDILFGDADGGPVVVVHAVGVGDDGVEVVVAAGHLEYDEDGFFGGGRHGGFSPMYPSLRGQCRRRLKRTGSPAGRR